MEPSENRKVSFNKALEVLLDISRPFPPTYLHSFSDLNPKDLIALKSIWAQVSETRRQALLEDLEELGDSDSLLSFEEVGKIGLKDEVAHVRALAIRLLWEAQDHKLVPTLIEMMKKDPDVEVRSTAASGLGIYVYLGEIEEIPATKLTMIENNLLEVMNGQEDILVRRRALESLGFSSRPEVADLIRTAFTQKSSDWIVSSLFAMGRSVDKLWESEILSQLRNEDEEIQEEAIQAAGELELTAARDTLLEILEDEPENEDIWAAVVWALSQIGGEGVREVLQNLEDKAENQEEIDLLDEAMDNLSFTEDMILYNLLDVKPEEIETDIYDSDGNIVIDDFPEEESGKKKKHKKIG